MVIEKKNNVAIYVRVSTDKQELMNQLSDLTQYARVLNFVKK